MRYLAALVALAASLAGQLDRPNATGNAAIAGRVIDAETRAPVAGASVSISRTRNDVESRAMVPADTVSARTVTEADGSFTFSRIPAGSYEVTAYAAGYRPGELGQLRATGRGSWVRIQADERFEQATIELFRAAGIRGRVLDEHGEPRRDVGVLAIDVNAHGRESWAAVFGGERTNEKGEYEISLPPGDYVIHVPVWRWTVDAAPPSVSSSGASLTPPPVLPANPNPQRAALPAQPVRPVGSLWARGFDSLPPDSNGAPRAYETSFYPGTPDPEQASVVHLQSGEKLDVNFALQAARSATVSGTFEGRNGPVEKGEVRLMRTTPFGYEIQEAMTFLGSDGAFNLVDVPVGRYALEAQRILFASGDSRSDDPMVTRIPVLVDEKGIAGLTVPLTEGARVHGTVVYQGTRPRPRLTDIRMQPFGVVSQNYRPSSGVSLDGTFEFGPVAPGRYVLLAQENGITPAWFIKSATSAGRDVTVEPLEVASGAAIDVLVTLTDRPTRVTGDIRDAAGRLRRDATVVVFPANRQTWLALAPESTARFQSYRAIRGDYSFVGLPPGTYFIAAVDERKMGAWPEAAFLASIAADATRVALEDGEVRQLPLAVR